MPEQNFRRPIPDVLTLRLQSGTGDAESATYARKADRITVRHRHGKIVAVIEIVSSGNKASTREFRNFVEKSAELLRQGVHLLAIDLFPPTKRDPQGIHKAIWDEIVDAEFQLPPDKPLTVVAYDAGPPYTAYVEPIAVGDALPSLPLFLQPEHYVPAPLELTYEQSWRVFPAAMKRLVDGLSD